MSKKKKIENTNVKIDRLDKDKRFTNIRLDIIECLSDGHHQHTAIEIIKHLKSKNKKVNTASIYNNLKFLLSQGIIDVYPNYESKNQKYEIIHNGEYHIHIRDYEKEKEEFFDVPFEVENSIKKFINEKGYDIHNLKIEVLARKGIKNK